MAYFQFDGIKFTQFVRRDGNISPLTWVQYRGEQRDYNREIRLTAMKTIAASFGDDEPKCRYETLPEGHVLKEHICYGRLEIDHINGGGSEERRTKKGSILQRDIAFGRRSVDDLRILCQLHQLWNRK